MAQTLADARKIFNGTYGEVWIDGVKVAECTALQAKVSLNKKTINLCGQFMSDTLATSADGKGSLTLFHVDSEFARRQSGIQDGVDNRATIITKLRRPADSGAERVALSNVSFDDLTLADWQAASEGTVTAPFTFGGYQYLDMA